MLRALGLDDARDHSLLLPPLIYVLALSESRRLRKVAQKAGRVTVLAGRPIVEDGRPLLRASPRAAHAGITTALSVGCALLPLLQPAFTVVDGTPLANGQH